MRIFKILMALALMAGATVCTAWAEPLWVIGEADDNTAELALGPNGYQGFKEDPVFLVGQSDPKTDWPYAHPGPSDAWAGGRQHTFTILFGLAKTVSEGTCRFVADLADAHSGAPPQLEVTINGHASTHGLRKGGGDASISGDLSAAAGHRVVVETPASALKIGTNEITITTVSGSWVLYDQVLFEAPAGVELGAVEGGTLLQGISSDPVLVERSGELHQLLRLSVVHLGEPTDATVEVTGADPTTVSLKPGRHSFEVAVPAVDSDTPVSVEMRIASSGEVLTAEHQLVPVRKWIVYLIHHTHLDIGYTHLQTEVEQKQWDFLEQAIELAEKTEDYPPEARFKWQPEGLWAVESYLARATPAQRDAFLGAVRNGAIGLDALYGNELTALCRPEELCELIGYANRLSKQYDLTIDSAMISDVPGYTWGLVPVLAEGGVKYLSFGPNSGHRIGYTRSAWSDRPFYWVSPSGQEKVLCWMAGMGYSWFHRAPLRDGQGIMDYLDDLETSGYPYDLVQVRYNIGGDNGPPDPELPDFVRDWNAKHAYPKLVIASTSEMFHEFERRYADVVPAVSGDFTPYWEDGAASSSLETGLNRMAAERLVQAQTLFAMLDPGSYPSEAFNAAWREVILYDEHTWGAHNSISQPESEFALGQWKIKQAFALEADRRSRELLDAALKPCNPAATAQAVLVFNTCSWPRTDVVMLPKDWPTPGDLVKDGNGQEVPSQRLSTGELVFVASDVPASGAAPFTVHAGTGGNPGLLQADADAASLATDKIQLIIDKTTGAIGQLKWAGLEADLVGGGEDLGLNDYFYVAGRDPKDPQRNGPVTVTVKENGPVMASLLVESDAPGCEGLSREIRVIAGLDRVDIINIVDKTNVYDPEGVHFAFPFNVPDGVMRMDTPWAVVRPEADQLPGSCKNYFTVQRWVDVSNQDFGVTWATVDAPLIEIGSITCDPRSVGWIKRLEPTSTFYSYVMNNYWETNYKAGQEGPTPFRYSIHPHRRFDSTAAARFGAEQSQPLIPVPVNPNTPVPASLVQVEPTGVVVAALKPSEDGKAYIVRLFGASGKPENAMLAWRGSKRPKIWRSNLAEEKVSRIEGPVPVPPYGLVTLRVQPGGA